MKTTSHTRINGITHRNLRSNASHRVRKAAMTVIAASTAAVLALAGCGSSSSGGSGSSSAATTSNFVLGGLWPETGSLASLAPPELAAEKLAVSGHQ